MTDFLNFLEAIAAFPFFCFGVFIGLYGSVFVVARGYKFSRLRQRIEGYRNRNTKLWQENARLTRKLANASARS